MRISDWSSDVCSSDLKGQIWSGADAKEAGLVDALGGYSTAVDLAKEAAAIPADAEVQLRPFRAQRDLFAALLEDVLSGEIQGPATLTLVRSLARVAELLAPLIRAAETGGRWEERSVGKECGRRGRSRRA